MKTASSEVFQASDRNLLKTRIISFWNTRFGTPRRSRTHRRRRRMAAVASGAWNARSARRTGAWRRTCPTRTTTTPSTTTTTCNWRRPTCASIWNVSRLEIGPTTNYLFVCFFFSVFFLPPPSKSTVDDVSEPIATNGEILHHNRRFVESYSLPSPFLFLGSLPARLARRMDPSFFFLVEVSLARWRWRCPTRICLFLVEASPGRWRLRRHTKKSPRSFRFFFVFQAVYSLPVDAKKRVARPHRVKGKKKLSKTR